MNILGFNPAHHSSVCLLQDGELKYFIQEERIGCRKKYDSLPFKGFIDLLQNYKIDFITWGTPSQSYPVNFINLYSPISYWSVLATKYHPEVVFLDYSQQHHHTTHAAHSFYNSGFKECITLIIDGLGSDFYQDEKPLGQETESIFSCSYPANFKLIYKNILLHNPNSLLNFKANLPVNFSSNINLSQVYETVTMHLGWTRNEAGKTMGLAPYGKFNSNLPPLFVGESSNPNIFIENIRKEYSPINNRDNEIAEGWIIDENSNPQLKLKKDPKEWHYDESKITDLEKDLAWKVQNDTQQIVGDYIEKAIKKTGLKQVCCAGGYFLNCVTNYYLQKRFPDVEFYFEPIANDAGTAIGAAKLAYHTQTQDTTIRPFKSLYLGKQYSRKELVEGIKKYT